MNERFEKLAEQAGLKSEIMLDDSSREVECFVAQYDECIPSIHYWEKFAELIIRECMEVAVYKDSGYMHPADVAGYMAAGRSTAASLIKEHFGVEL